MKKHNFYKIVIEEEINPTYDKQNAYDQGFEIAYKQEDILKMLPNVSVSVDYTWNDKGYTNVLIEFRK
jgi:hypothetical protein